ncbi:MAG: co-chaperone DjlA [Proteobacteria bacterium]|uniref:Co-chaperone DjlA n=1 Tax=Candidatus Avisuccinivibrio stercorigallinarum TaxID=2840704 RepID=A0A9D9GU72_9GAMM|nr:co-chaperone DjlA [Candidatus Avisuccinivibrio stercorigallinarum]
MQQQSWMGRIVGTVIGLLFFNPLTALIGFAIGWYFVDKPRNQAARARQEASQAFSYAGGGQGGTGNFEIMRSSFALMGYVARGAGRVNEAHIQLAEIMIARMGMDDHGRNMAVEAFNRGKDPSFNFRSEIGNLLREAHGNNTIIAYIVEFLVEIALADGSLQQGEYDRLVEVTGALGIGREQLDRWIELRRAQMRFAEYMRRAQQQWGGAQGSQQQGWGGQQQGQWQDQGQQSYGGGQQAYQATENDLQNAYQILGVESTASFEEIKKAHRRLMLKYHPDRLASQGLPPEMVRMYTEKAQEIQAAFDLIKKARGEK